MNSSPRHYGSPFAVRIKRVIAAKKLAVLGVTQAEIGRILGCSQPMARQLIGSDIRGLRGEFAEYARAIGVSTQRVFSIALIADGLCGQCGAAREDKGKTKCEKCLAKLRKDSERRRSAQK